MKEQDRKNLLIILVVVLIVICTGCTFTSKNTVQQTETDSSANQSPEEQKYQKAKELYDSGMYIDAVNIFYEINSYRDSIDYYYKSVYQLGKKYLGEKDYDLAVENFKKISGYQDADDQIKECSYQQAKDYLTEKNTKKIQGSSKNIERD